MENNQEVKTDEVAKKPEAITEHSEIPTKTVTMPLYKWVWLLNELDYSLCVINRDNRNAVDLFKILHKQIYGVAIDLTATENLLAQRCKKIEKKEETTPPKRSFWQFWK